MECLRARVSCGPMPSKPSDAAVSADQDVEQLRAEVARLRELVGPNEQSYVQLKMDVWAARDAVIGAEAESGILRGRIKTLDAELVRALREQRWIRAEIIHRLRQARSLHRQVLRLLVKVSGS